MHPALKHCLDLAVCEILDLADVRQGLWEDNGLCRSQLSSYLVKEGQEFVLRWVKLSYDHCSTSLAVGDLRHVRPRYRYEHIKVLVISVEVP